MENCPVTQSMNLRQHQVCLLASHAGCSLRWLQNPRNSPRQTLEPWEQSIGVSTLEGGEDFRQPALEGDLVGEMMDAYLAAPRLILQTLGPLTNERRFLVKEPWSGEEIYQEVTVSTKKPRATYPEPFPACSMDERLRNALQLDSGDSGTISLEFWIYPLTVSIDHAFGQRAEFPTRLQLTTGHVKPVSLATQIDCIENQLRSCIAATCLE